MGRYAQVGAPISLRRRLAGGIGRRAWLWRLARNTPRDRGEGPVVKREDDRVVVRPKRGWRSRSWAPALFAAATEDEVFAWLDARA
jgi:hypothetical protein